MAIEVSRLTQNRDATLTSTCISHRLPPAAAGAPYSAVFSRFEGVDVLSTPLVPGPVSFRGIEIHGWSKKTWGFVVSDR